MGAGLVVGGVVNCYQGLVICRCRWFAVGVVDIDGWDDLLVEGWRRDGGLVTCKGGHCVVPLSKRRVAPDEHLVALSSKIVHLPTQLSNLCRVVAVRDRPNVVIAMVDLSW